MSPSLTPEEQEEMLFVLKDPCGECGQTIKKNYCRGCDDFFFQGHLSKCSRKGDQHIGHRTY